MRPIRIGTRASALARWQAQEVARALHQKNPEVHTELVELTTPGDDHPDAPLERMEGVGWFTSTLERALLEHGIDVAVHSYKDLPVAEESALAIVATLPRGPVEDVLVARAGARLETLPPGARVGTSSLRRLAQLRLLRADLAFVPLRGNVPTRLDRVARGELDAVVLARAGLERLDLTTHVSEVFPVASVLPAPGQGALAIQVRACDADVTELASALDHAPTHRAVRAEREVLRRLRGGCSVPVGVVVRAQGPRFQLAAGVFAIRGSEALRVQVEGPDPLALAEDAARQLIQRGALRILERETAPAAIMEAPA